MKSKFTLFLSLVLALVTSLSFAQEKTITGNVTAASDGFPLPGVSVVVQGTSRGVQSDFDGNFAIKAESNESLVFSYLGLQTQTIRVGNKTVINVSLKEDAEALEEVVVIGYGAGQSKTKLTSAVTIITAESVESRPNASLVQTLQSQAPGLSISTGSGQPGSNSVVLLRGVTSLAGNSEPLFILDGVPIDEDNFRSLNPNDIESINVLKDGSASALYGSRGAAGVIEIRSKSGKFNSKFSVTYRGQTGFTSAQKPNFETLNTGQAIAFERLAGNTNYDTMAADPNRSFLVSESVDTNWADILLRQGNTVSHELSMTSGSENASTYNSIAYYEQEGITRRSNLQRFSVRSNFNGKSNDNKFTFGSAITANFSKSSFIQNEGSGSLANPFLVAYLAKPYLNPYNADGSLNTVGLNRDGFDVTPYVSLNNTVLNTNSDEEIKVIGSLNTSVELAPNLRAGASFGMDFTQVNDLVITSPESIYGQNAPDPASFLKGSQFERQTRDLQTTMNASLSYSKTFNDLHSLDVSAFTEFNKNIFDGMGFTGYGIDPRLEGYNFAPGTLQEFPTLDADGDGLPDAGTTPTLSDLALFYPADIFSQRTEVALFSYFGILKYDFDSKYGFDASIRRDASSRFNRSNKWGTFWSVAARWNLDQESFLANSDFVSSLKLRASYGTAGNDRISGGRFGGTTLTYNLYGVGGGYNATQGVAASSLANPDLKWETTEQYNIGVDFGFMNDRLNGSVDVYDKRTSDLFYATPNTLISTFGTLFKNIGSMSNKGVELILDYTVVQNENFKWSVNGNASYNKNEITELLDGETIEAGRVALEEGQPFNSFYAVRWAGVNPANGRPIYLDIDGNPTSVYNTDDRVYVDKSTIPKIQGGFGTSMNYKGITFDALFGFVGEVYRYNNAFGVAEDPNLIGLANQSTTVLDVWQQPGDITNIPSLASGSTRNRLTDQYLENASYLRLRNVSMGYNFGGDILEKLPFSAVKIFLQGENLLTWTAWRGFDPEADAFRVQDFFNYPTPRIVTLGLDVKF